MKFPLSVVKILKLEFSNLLVAEDWLGLLMEGDLHNFEKKLYSCILGLYDKICERSIVSVSKELAFVKHQKSLAKSKNLSKLVVRTSTIQLRTGTLVHYDSYYAKQAAKDYQGDRHVSRIYWKVHSRASAMFSSVATLLSVICPSFAVTKMVLSHFEVCSHATRIRQVLLSLSSACVAQRPTIQLKPEETLEDKRVVIAIDGGRSRTRVYQDQKEGKDKKWKKFQTPWREPKMFVISIVDGDGKMDKKKLPIYDSTFKDEAVFQLLEQYLAELEIHKAKEVQFLADGAPWIWARARSMLIRLGVEASKITETLDYYHAAEHLHDLVKYMNKDKAKQSLCQLKEHLWKGEVEQIGEILKREIQGVDLETFTPFQYFAKNSNRINYQKFTNKKLLCGSGIIESGIRRIINLRFKSPSAFWYPDHLEKLILMRCIALSGRWDIMMKNLNRFT